MGIVVGLSASLFAVSDAAADVPTDVLMADQYLIDQCFFGSTATPPGFARMFEGCSWDGGDSVDENKIDHRRVQCVVTYDPSEVYKPKFKRSYSAEYQHRLLSDGALSVRIVLVSTSQVMEAPDRACKLPQWQRMPKDP